LQCGLLNGNLNDYMQSKNDEHVKFKVMKKLLLLLLFMCKSELLKWYSCALIQCAHSQIKLSLNAAKYSCLIFQHRNLHCTFTRPC
jgi:hypothetical protein